MGFDPARMKEYKPDWVRRDQYEAAVTRSPLRQAILNAAQITTHQKLPGMPTLIFPAVESPEFKDVMAANQAKADRTAYTVDEALGPITAVAKLRNRETSRRWQAHFDLIRGRLLAMKVRCYEYNWACPDSRKIRPNSRAPGPMPGDSYPIPPSSIVKRRRRRPVMPTGCCTASSRNIPIPPGPCSPSGSSKIRSASSGSRPTCLRPDATTITPRLPGPENPRCPRPSPCLHRSCSSQRPRVSEPTRPGQDVRAVVGPA